MLDVWEGGAIQNGEDGDIRGAPALWLTHFIRQISKHLTSCGGHADDISKDTSVIFVMYSTPHVTLAKMIA